MLPDAVNASEAVAAQEPDEAVDELAALAAEAAAAKRRRIRNVAAIALPLAPADGPEQVAGVGIRLRVQQMHKAWNVFVSGSSPVDGWQMVPPCRCHRCVGVAWLHFSACRLCSE